MKIKKITSLTALLSFLVLFLTSIILYIVPHGRVAYWSDWRLWGMTKTQWGNIHINTGFLFLISICLHIYFNWKPIFSYLKNQTRQLRIFTKDFNMAAILTISLVMGTYFEMPPFVWVIDFSDSIKNAASKKYGEPPYGHAELSTLKLFTSRMDMDLSKSMEQLKNKGVVLENEHQTILEIAQLNKMSPKKIYLSMKAPQKNMVETLSLPDNPPPGFGNRLLADLCHEYQLNIPKIMRLLADEKINARPDMSIKMIAKKNNISPIDLYTIIKNNS